MSNYDFTHLHVHSHGSLLDGYSTSEEYIEAAIKNNQKALGQSDHGNLFKGYEFLKLTKKAGITGILGCEFYVAPENPEGAFVQTPVFYGNEYQRGEDVSARGSYLHLSVWAVNNVGLNNLFKLSTKSYDPRRIVKKYPRIDFDLLAEHSEGLVVSTGCPSSEISTRFRLGQDKAAYEYASRLKDVFGDRLFVEIMDHNMGISLEKDLLPKQLELSKKLNIPLLATNDAHYAYEHNHSIHEEMLALQTGSKMNEPTLDEGGSRFAFNGKEYYLKSSEDMARLFPERDFPGAIKNTMLIAEMATDVHISYDPNLRPAPQLPEGYSESVDYYKDLLKEGFKDRFKHAPKSVINEARERIQTELEVIHSSDFVDYMLVVEDYLNWYKETYSTRNAEGKIMASSIGPGRGSVGGSIHSFFLGISEVDPIRFGLFFERFLSAGRGPVFRLHYDDGTSEEHVVSNKVTVLRNGEEKSLYVHQLQEGDLLVCEDEEYLEDSSMEKENEE